MTRHARCAPGLSALTIRLAQQDGGSGLSVGHTGDIHADNISTQIILCNSFVLYLHAYIFGQIVTCNKLINKLRYGRGGRPVRRCAALIVDRPQLPPGGVEILPGEVRQIRAVRRGEKARRRALAGAVRWPRRRTSRLLPGDSPLQAIEARFVELRPQVDPGAIAEEQRQCGYLVAGGRQQHRKSPGAALTAHCSAACNFLVLPQPVAVAADENGDAARRSQRPLDVRLPILSRR